MERQYRVSAARNGEPPTNELPARRDTARAPGRRAASGRPCTADRVRARAGRRGAGAGGAAPAARSAVPVARRGRRGARAGAAAAAAGAKRTARRERRASGRRGLHADPERHGTRARVALLRDDWLAARRDDPPDRAEALATRIAGLAVAAEAEAARVGVERMAGDARGQGFGAIWGVVSLSGKPIGTK